MEYSVVYVFAVISLEISFEAFLRIIEYFIKIREKLEGFKGLNSFDILFFQSNVWTEKAILQLK